MTKSKSARPPFVLAGHEVEAGERTHVNVPLPSQSSYMPISMPVHVVHAKRDGPTLFLSAAVHGDEINGIEIIRQVMAHSALNRMRGTLIAVPIVNVYGFTTHTRYLPDRRDLNRSFPGSQHGSLASRLAYVFASEIIDRCTHGIDLHTGANHRTNHPHIRANLDDQETEIMARAFGTPVIINANMRDGSLRQYAAEKNVKTLLYEAGEALRFNSLAIRAGVRGVLNVMRVLDMIGGKPSLDHSVIKASESQWVRAPKNGLLRIEVHQGTRIEKGDTLGTISDAIGKHDASVISPVTGIVIGRTNLPVVNEGDALFHIARFNDSAKVESAIETFHSTHIEGLGPGDYPDLGVV
ncbi:succinylglutamate desuccinylase [Iodidimonas muriae]|uniref:Succinylglutamate desuccinylase n=1 Tax=Iodidimonas muriae TaxID=261467 RepID=A0ABQ2LE10_9PROT|nr:succinylglutamate desuccinylase/aspartoacylase family protein [Iodidimonas muriae]GER07221.1 succinylglutamate desuccinylase [Kordiimonadales bacterium JCM 17843]GGO11454.1 succinylglutamate desuccinylase [Iodidimonas muriae]